MRTVKVNGVLITLGEFEKLKEQVDKEKNKILKEISPGEYRVLTRMRG